MKYCKVITKDPLGLTNENGIGMKIAEKYQLY